LSFPHPKGEQVWVLAYHKDKSPAYIITSKAKNRDTYYFYEIAPDGSLKKLGKSRSAGALEEKYASRVVKE
jgi:hypothetical protein